MTHHKRPTVIAATVAAFISIPIALLYTNYAISNQAAPAKLEHQPDRLKVTVVPVRAKSHHHLMHSFAEVEPVDEINLKSEVSGKVVWHNPKFINGGRLQRGELLIQIDATEYELQLANAQQNLAEAQLALEQEKHQRKQALRDWKLAGIKEPPSKLAMREPHIAIANAQYKAARNAFKSAQQNVEKTQVKAPFNAVIEQRQVSKGSYLEQGELIASLSNSEQAKLQLALTAEQWQQLPNPLQNMNVTLTSDQLPNIHWQGRAEQLSMDVDKGTRLRTLTVIVDKPLDQSKPLLFGSFVKAELVSTTVSNLFALPASALTADGHLWYVVDDQIRRASRTPIFSHNENHYVARGDLPQQLNLVRKPVSSYLDGMAVRMMTDKTFSDDMAASKKTVLGQAGINNEL